MLVATAGHIDHGKTSLVRCLTGTNTDRLPEERARGISIDLGFAHWTGPTGRQISFIDVPGHERFVRNMLAGVSGADFAMLVVAADDGVMPQTIEHVQILDLLGMRHGCVVITKCDRASSSQVEDVRQEVRKLLGPTTLNTVKILEVCALTGEGIGELARELDKASTEAPLLRDNRNFRLAIDRVFTIPGAGTVATGTILDGWVSKGDSLVVSPAGLTTRVRGLQYAGQTVDQAKIGQRCALNLSGLDVSDLRRGDWLVAADMHLPTMRVDVVLRMLPGQIVKHAGTVHIHVDTKDVQARVLVQHRPERTETDERFATLVFERPISAIVGSRFVIRDAAGRSTIGGGRVVDPFATKRRGDVAERVALCSALDQQTPEKALAALLEVALHEVDVQVFRRRFNLTQTAGAKLFAQPEIVVLETPDPIAIPSSRAKALRGLILDCLQKFHRLHADKPGLRLRELKLQLPNCPSDATLFSLIRSMATDKLVDLRGSFVCLHGHRPVVPAGEVALWQRLLPTLKTQPWRPFQPRELAAQSGSSEAVIRTMLHRLARQGEVWHFAEGRYLLQDALVALVAVASRLAAAPSDTVAARGFSAAQFRDATGMGRNLVIQILEGMDRLGVTSRVADLRVLRPDYER